MTKCKLIIAAIIALTLSSNVLKAQESRVSFNIRGGLNISNYGGDLDDTKNALKQHVGLGLDIAVAQNTYLLIGIDYQSKGTKIDPKIGETIKYNADYLQVPVHAAYKIRLFRHMKFVAEAGPYVAFGVGGKIKGREKVNTFGDGRLKRLDCGGSFAVGAEFYRNFLKVGYNCGFNNISDKKGVKIRNRDFFISSGFMF